ncbi:MAG: GrpB family protein [Leptolyngbyaceae cyanobacterium MO_188.B28]|nr:GrpB family protein [Leptolyngbyaceae cyanobacterium MO_188.B28]
MKGEQSTDSSKMNPPLTEDQIIAAAVGQPQVLNSTIYLAPYNPAWPSLYTQLETNIRETLGNKLLLIEHVGSTSVPGLSAKPIIDMVLAVADSADESAYVQPLEKKGYTLRVREPDWYEHRLLKPPDIDGNLHVFSAGCEEINQMLLFRNWLRSHPEDRLLYENTKRRLAAQTWKYTQNYANAKSAIVREILARARSHQTQ